MTVFLFNQETPQQRISGPEFVREGFRGKDFVFSEVLDHFRDTAVAFINNYATTNKDKPFFIYFPVTSPHTPHTPHAFRGISRVHSLRADLIEATDAVFGSIYAALDSNNLTDNTIVIFTTDNGSDVNRGAEQNVRGEIHNAFQFNNSSGKSITLRGKKTTIYEGGHRVPLIISWPDNHDIVKGSVSDQLFSQTDIFPTIASILRVNLPPEVARDGLSLLPALTDASITNLRTTLVSHSFRGYFALRKGPWKYIADLDPSEDGSSSNVNGIGSLYNLENDIGETTNLLSSMPTLVQELRDTLISYGYVEPAAFANPFKTRSVPLVRDFYVSRPVSTISKDPIVLV